MLQAVIALPQNGIAGYPLKAVLCCKSKTSFMKNTRNTIVVAGLFALFFSAGCNRSNIINGNGDGIDIHNRMAISNAPGGDDIVTTVAIIKPLDNGDIEYLFNERQAGYVVKKDHPDFDAILRLAREAQAAAKPVKLLSDVPGVLTGLTTPTTAETAAYLEWYRSNILNAEPNRKLTVSLIDTLVFNIADWQRWKVFGLCKTLVPDYATAKKIFDYCKQQTCVIGPTQVQPCIPFQYVRDGCFARAHKMRSIIEGRYRYCSEKVFSFGYGSTLYVQATLGGGCCVNWWYHVAPVVRVKVGAKTLCYVIDPGMFTQPVLLSTWLAAQENTTCSSSANLSSYSIQPSSAYTPVYANPVTQYTTDNGYTATNNDLVIYNGYGQTCGN
jgi:Glutaminase